MIALYTTPSPGAAVICADELGPVSARIATGPGLVVRWAPAQRAAGMQPRPGSGLGLRRAARGRWPGPDVDGTDAQPRGVPAVASRAGSGQSAGGSLRAPRQSDQPPEPADPRVAQRPPRRACCLHPQRSLLAQSPRSVVAATRPRSVRRAAVRRRPGDRPGYSDCHRPAHPPRQALDLGATSASPSTSPPLPRLPSLRNGTLGRASSTCPPQGNGRLHRTEQSIYVPLWRPALYALARCGTHNMQERLVGENGAERSR